MGPAVGAGVGEKMGGGVGSAGYDGVGVGVAFLACPGGVFLVVADEAIATARCGLALAELVGDVVATVEFESDCLGPSHRNKSKKMASSRMTPTRFNWSSPLHHPVDGKRGRKAIRNAPPIVNGAVAEWNQRAIRYSVSYDVKTQPECERLTR